MAKNMTKSFFGPNCVGCYLVMPRSNWWQQIINPFVPSAPSLYPLKTSDNLFSGFRESVHWERMG